MKTSYTHKYTNNMLPKKDITVLRITHKNKHELSCLHEYTSLKKLVCSAIGLTHLPKLPQTLEELRCANNELTQLPILPHTIRILICYNNKLTLLPTLPPSLVELICNFNNILQLPLLPDGLQLLECSNNQLTTLPELPCSLVVFECTNNPYINPMYLQPLDVIIELQNTTYSCKIRQQRVLFNKANAIAQVSFNNAYAHEHKHAISTISNIICSNMAFNDAGNDIIASMESGKFCNGVNPKYVMETVYTSDIILSVTSSKLKYGFAAINLSNKSIILNLLCTHSDMRGIGTYIMELLTQIATCCSLAYIELTATPSSKTFYINHGFDMYDDYHMIKKIV